MKKALIRDINRINLLNVLVFGTLTFLFIGAMLWYEIVEIRKDRLLRVTKLLEMVIKENSAVLDDRDGLVKALQPFIHKIMGLYPCGYAVGFYSRHFNQVIIAESHNPSKITIGVNPLPGDVARKSWKTLKPQYELYWSDIRGAWILKCSNPVVINGAAMGYTFAYATLSTIIYFYFCFIFWVALMLILIFAAFMTLIKRTARKIQENARKLLILDNFKDRRDFDYEEFEKIAEVNSRRFQELYISEKNKSDMLANFPWGYAVINSAGKVVDVNNHGASSLGFTPEGQLKPDEACFDSPLYEALKKKTKIIREIIPPGTGGSEQKRYFACCFPMEFDTGEQGAMGWFIDITHQKRLEEEIMEHARKIQDILNSITDGFFALSREWRFTYINNEVEWLWGKKADALLGEKIWEAIPETIKTPIYDNLHEAMREKKKVQFNFFSAAADGKWVEFYVYPSSLGLSVCFRDVTDKKETEMRVKQLATIVETSNDAIISTDLRGNILSWNKGAEKMYGYTSREILHKSFLLLLSEEEKKIFSGRRMSGTCKSKYKADIPEIETTRITKTGKIIDVSVKLSFLEDGKGNITGIATIHRDITERKKYQNALTAERENLLVTLNSLGDGVIAVDQEGKVTFMNRTAEQLTGWNKDDAIGKPLKRVFYAVYDNTSEPCEILLEDVRKTGGNLSFGDLVLVNNKDCREVPVSLSCSLIKSLEEKYAGMVMICRDVTEKRKIEAELLKAEKLESLGMMAGGIAHDFNNVLTAILANLELAQAKLAKGLDVGRYLEETINAARKAADITRQLVLFSRGEAPVKRFSSLPELVKDTVAFILRGANIKVEYSESASLHGVEIDEGQISQVISNLIINSKQAMPNGGTIHILMKNASFKSAGRFTPGDYVKLTIKDNGIGIPRKNLHKIFDPFFTTKKDGTGLGLSTVYSIIKKHNGYIEVESKEGNGAAFNIYLPAASDQIARKGSGMENKTGR